MVKMPCVSTTALRDGRKCGCIAEFTLGLRRRDVTFPPLYVEIDEICNLACSRDAVSAPNLRRRPGAGGPDLMERPQ